MEPARRRKFVATRFVLSALITEALLSDFSPSGVFIPARLNLLLAVTVACGININAEGASLRVVVERDGA